MPVPATPIPFPRNGISENAPYSEKPPLTTPSALNCRTFDIEEDRARGGQREGLTRWIPEPVNTAIYVDNATADFTGNAEGELHISSTGAFADYVWHEGDFIRVTTSTGNVTADTNYEVASRVDDDAILLRSSSNWSSGDDTIDFQLVGSETGAKNRIQFIGQYTQILDKRAVEPRRLLHEDLFNRTDGTEIDDGNATWAEYYGDQAHSNHPPPLEDQATSNVWKVQNDVATIALSDMDETKDEAFSILKQGSDFRFPQASRYVLRARIKTFTGESTADQETYFQGFFFRARPGQDETFAAGWHRNAGNVGGDTNYRLRIFKHDGTTRTTLASSSSDVAADNEWHDLAVHVRRNYIEVYWDDVLQVSYTLTKSDGFDGALNRHIGFTFSRRRDANNWSTSATGDVPKIEDLSIWFARGVSNFRRNRAVVVSGGNIYTGAPGIGWRIAAYEALDEDVDTVEGVEAFQKFYFVDGTNMKILDFSDLSVSDWTASAGSLPGSAGDRPRLITRWRGRVVLAGVEADPHNWFMTHIGDPTDFDTTKSDGQQAVNGSSVDFGSIGRPITALVPFFEAAMIFGCDNAVWRLDNDPLEAGEISEISHTVGIVGPRAVAWGPDKSLYFFGTDGLYRLAPNQFNITQQNRISAMRVDRTFSTLDTSENLIQLEWDSKWHGLHIFITPVEENLATHYFAEERGGAFWPMRLPDVMNPTSCHIYDADDPNDRATLLGGFDSVIRKFDALAGNDDGQAIVSHVVIGPFAPYGPHLESKLVRTHVVLDEHSDQMFFQVRTADTFETAPNGVIHFAGTFGPGRNPVWTNRARGYAICFVLGNSTDGQRWALEELAATFVMGGRVRDRRDRAPGGRHADEVSESGALFGIGSRSSGGGGDDGDGNDDPGGGGGFETEDADNRGGDGALLPRELETHADPLQWFPELDDPSTGDNPFSNTGTTTEKESLI